MAIHNYIDKINSWHFHTDRRYIVLCVPLCFFYGKTCVHEKERRKKPDQEDFLALFCQIF